MKLASNWSAVVKKAKLFLIPLIVSILVITQFALVYAAPSHDKADAISGTIDQVTQITDPNTGVSIYEITLTDDQGEKHTVRVSEETAYGLGLLVPDDDGNLVLLDPNSEDWPSSIEIPVKDILPEEGMKHPVANALAIVFAGIDGVDYDAIMSAHEDGYGFGVIAQALWMTQKLPDGTSDDMQAILDAKTSGDYSYFSYLFPDDENPPTNWGQFRKALMAGDKKQNLGDVMSVKEKDPSNPDNGGNANQGNTDTGSTKDKDNNKDKSKNGNNGNTGNHGNPNKP